MTEHTLRKPASVSAPTLASRLSDEKYALVFSGQGFDWQEPLRAAVAQGAGPMVESLVKESNELLAPVRDELVGLQPRGFDPLGWEKVNTTPAALSVPGIVVAQLAVLDVLESKGFDIEVPAVGHSQGVLGVLALRDLSRAAEVVAVAQLIGAVVGHQGRKTGLVSQGERSPMVAVEGVSRQRLESVIGELFPGGDCAPVVGLKNGWDSFVVCGRPADVARVEGALEARWNPVAAEVAFHHPAMAPGVERVAQLAERAGLDVGLAREAAEKVMVDFVDWPADLEQLNERWLVDVGPGSIVKLTQRAALGRGVRAVSHEQLFDASSTAELPRSYDEYAPTLVRENGVVRLRTKFTELTGRSPMLLGGMTPTTVDPEIVAAAANAGHWAELAGGGQVTPELLEENLAKLDGLLNPGVNAQFNSMFLDPYLWKMQIGGKRLVPKARANGAPIDGIVVTAGIPEDGPQLVEELHAAGFPWVAFKPGSVKQVKQVLKIASEVDSPIIMHLEGGKAGGHHSWEDLDDLLIRTYDDIRSHENVVLCVGGGIGTPECAADYLTGEWSVKYELPKMPTDGILLGTAAMATKEAKTSDAVKDLLVATKGSQEWVPAGEARNGMASGRSQLGADIHEIDNSFARAGRLLDEVAGDEEAALARREEIIAAIDKTAKKYFGDLDEMTYREWLDRYLELSGPDPEWIDVSWFNRFAQMVEHTQARLVEQDRGTFTPAITADKDNPRETVNKLAEAFDLDQKLHPADRAWFVKLARTPGKPVNFVPVIDKDVRRWWRSDSLWQSHDARYSADEVAIIPGIASVAGITVKDEPVADLLARFNQASIDRLDSPEEATTCLLTRIIHASGTYWAGRNTTSLIERLGDVDKWLVNDTTATHAPTGATLTVQDEQHAILNVDNMSIRISVTDPYASPQVTQEDAEASMGELTRIAAGGTLGAVEGDRITWHTTVDASEAAAYANVTAGFLPEDIVPAGTAPDVLVGKAWPAIFAAVKEAKIPGTGDSVVEGMLSLVHLEHHITLSHSFDELVREVTHDGRLDRGIDLYISARAEEVDDTEIGRVVLIRAEISAGPDRIKIARLAERMAIRGRRGNSIARTNTSVLPTHENAPRSFRARAVLTAPESMRSFAAVSGDHNPIHVSETAAKLAGLPGVIVHGMWTSAMAQLIAGGRVLEYTATMLAPVLPGQEIEFVVERTGVDTRVGRGEVREITATVDGTVVLTATATMQAPSTFYAFPGQGIQSPGMGMEARGRSQAAREVWDRADAHTRKLGFSILEIVQNNPTEVVVDGETFTHPKGVLFLTQFTQVAMATLGVAQVAEMREAHALNRSAYFAGHSVGEYNALAAYAGVLSLENVVEIVYQRGLTMHRLVERDANGESNYGLAAVRPHKMGADITTVIEEVKASSGEFLEIVNYNLEGMQYAVAGTRAGLKALEADVDRRAPGQRAFILIPGIDVPFHSTRLLGGVDAFREHLDSLIPDDVSLDALVGRYIPNLVARPFELTREFAESILEVVDSQIVKDLLANFEAEAEDPVNLARALLVELLAWQFASPVRWIETQDWLLTHGVERFVEVGVGSAPTIANMMGQTLSLPKYKNVEIEVLNIERDRDKVFATDEVVEQKPEPEAEPQSEPQPEPQPTPTPAPATGGPRPEDIVFTPADATEMLIALWTKVRPDQMTATDSIEALVEGVSSRRNQLLLDLGVEFNLGAIDGAADAELNDLKATVTSMARGYSAFGPVLSDAVADALRRVTGPAGKKPGYVAERITQTWELGQGWADHVVAEVVMGAREGASLRGGDLATLTAKDLDGLIDEALNNIAGRRGVTVTMPGGGQTEVFDSSALEAVTGKEGILAETARTILANLGLNETPQAALDDEDSSLEDVVARELGSDWARQVAPVFSEELAVQLDDRWASAREDLVRQKQDIDLTGAGEAVARMAEFYGRSELAAQARSETPLEYATDVAVVTGASPNSIAAAVVEKLLAGGATVVATTSSMSHDRLSYYKDLYARSARGNACLWVVPANLSSFTDLDALVSWIGSPQSATVNGATKLLKPALKPTLLFPFAAPRVAGSLLESGPQSEMQMRLLLWSVERLIAGLSKVGNDTHVGQRLHVVLPGSPNRGRFGGDGAYGESKAALDALVARWNVESWKNTTSLVHVLIGWVRGTGLMGGNDPLVAAVEAEGVTTFSTEEMAANLIAQIAPDIRNKTKEAPLTVDFTGGLGDINLAALSPVENEKETETPATVKALPTPYRRIPWTDPNFDNVTTSLDDMVVIVGAGELGPYGSSRTRFDAELTGDLSAAGVVELAWSMGLIANEDGVWYAGDEEVDEADIVERFHDEVLARVGVRQFHDDFGMVDNLAPELTTVYLDSDMSFSVPDKATAKSFMDGSTHVSEESGEWIVTRKAGSAVRVPRRMAMSRFVGGQIPEGFDPSRYGIPADMVDNLDRVAVWNLVCTVDAFLSSGFTPAELLAAVHPARVSSTQGTGMGGMESMRSLYVDRLLNEPRANDILQEALPNVVAAHVMQSYVGGYGQMIHPVAACATAAVSVEEAVDKLRLKKADFVVAGGIDDLSVEGITGFGDMAATADSQAMRAKGIEDRYFSRANDRRRGGFVESAGGGTILLARGSLAADLGLPVLGVVPFAESFADGAHTSIPAPGLGALGAARGGVDSRLARELAAVGVSPDEVSVLSKHDTSTTANDPNESNLHELIAASLGRSSGNPLFVVSQKSLTGHAKGGAAAFQMVGLTQVLRSGMIPANFSLDCVDPVLKQYEHLVWLRQPLQAKPKAGLLTSLGFGHVSALVAVVHPGAFVAALRNERGNDAAETWLETSRKREEEGLDRITSAVYGGAALYERPVDRNLGSGGKDLEVQVLLSDDARLVDGTYRL